MYIVSVRIILGHSWACSAAPNADEEAADNTTGAGDAASAASSPADSVPSADSLTLDKAVTDSALIQVKPALLLPYTTYRFSMACLAILHA